MSTLRFLRLPGELRHLYLASESLKSTTIRFNSTSSLPRVAQPSLWQSLVPKFLRSDNRQTQRDTDRAGNREWNPATSFILLGILVGSQAIHLINVKKDMVNFSRKTDTKIALLREVIRRVQAGEEVDVEKLLGTGDPNSEEEWKQVMKEIEGDDHIWAEKKWKVKRKEQAQAASEPARVTASPSASRESGSSATDLDATATATTKPGVRFY